jgi:hypothetical protein
VDGAGSDDNKEALVWISAIDDCYGFVTAANDRLLRLGCLGNLMLEKVGRCKRIVSANW